MLNCELEALPQVTTFSTFLNQNPTNRAPIRAAHYFALYTTIPCAQCVAEFMFWCAETQFGVALQYELWD
jgi:hypothetical protein